MVILLFFYDFLFCLGLLVYLPRALRRKRINSKSLKEKFAFTSVKVEKESIWIQVVSVGEVNVIGCLIKHLKEELNYEIVISTTTLTGNKLAKEKYGSFAKVIFFPFDISFVIKRMLKRIRPKIFIAVETEIWPNLFYQLKRKAVPIIIINGRISAKAFKRYVRVGFIMKRVLALCDYIAVQNQDYMNKFLSLGAVKDKLIIGGNMKFESIVCDKSRLNESGKKYLPIVKKPGEMLIVAGSTHAPEEEALLSVYENLRKKSLACSLVIAPRHIERSTTIEKLIKDRGLIPVRLSKTGGGATANAIFILDTIGDLLYFYGIADICFVGGSLSSHGGHNILEPIYFLKPTLFGPSMENFSDIVGLILEREAGIQVADVNSFEKELERLLIDDNYRKIISQNCALVFKEENRSLEVHLGLIARFLKVKA